MATTASSPFATSRSCSPSPTASDCDHFGVSSQFPGVSGLSPPSRAPYWFLQGRRDEAMVRARIFNVFLISLAPTAALAHGTNGHPADPNLHVDASLDECS